MKNGLQLLWDEYFKAYEKTILPRLVKMLLKAYIAPKKVHLDIAKA